MDRRDKPAAFDVTATAPSRPGGSQTRLERGSRIGRYTILDVLGEGGMGIVYAAHDPDLDRKVALKLLHDAGDDLLGEAGRARLLREARAMARVNHPNVITVYEVGTVGGRDFVAMELVDGPNLAQWLRTPRPWQAVMRAFVDAGRGLAAAHRSGLVHRDFKPANVLVTRDGAVRVTDFGLVRSIDDPGSESPPAAELSASVIARGDTLAPARGGLTMTGAMIGTPAYMSPEQHDGSRATERSDQFSFCVALYEALYGSLPYPGDDLGSLRASIRRGVVAEPKEPPIPAPSRRAILRGLQIDPGARFGSMDELLAELAPPPRSPLVRVAIIAGGISAVIALVVTLAVGRGSDGDPCAAVSREIDAVWNADVQRRLAARFGRDQAAFSERFTGAIAAYTRQWTTSSSAVCRASATGKAERQNDALLQRRCLLERKSALASALEVLGGADRSGLEHAVDIALGLPAIADCDDVDALRAGIQTPASEAVRQKVATVRQEIDQARVLRLAVQHTAAQKRAQAALAAARAIDYPPVVAEALLELGTCQRAGGVTSAARATLREAELVAEEAGHDRVRARALVEQVALETSYSSKPEAVAELERRAVAAIRRWGREPELSAQLDRALAELDRAQRRPEAAVARLERAVDTLVDKLGRSDLEVAATLFALAESLAKVRRDHDAAERLREALDIRRRLLPADHPTVVMAAERYAQALIGLYRYDEAHALLTASAPFWATERGKQTLAELLPPSAQGVATRKVRGRVVDPGGKPVAGALVFGGESLIVVMDRLDVGMGGVLDAQLHVQRVRTGADGRFEVDVPAADGVVMAEALPIGRSAALRLGAGEEIRGDIALRPFGRLEGRVAGAGPRSGELAVIAREKGLDNRLGGYLAQVLEDDTFRFERLAAGDYELLVVMAEAQEGNLRMSGSHATVRPGETTRAELRLSAGTEIQVEVVEKTGRPLASVQVLLARGKIKATRAQEFNEQVADKLDLQMAFVPPAPARFVGVAPGQYSICGAILSGDVRDPEYSKKLDAETIRALPIRCEPVTIAAGQVEYHHRLVVTAPASK